VSEPRTSTRTYADFDIRSPFRSYFRVGRDLLIELETFVIFRDGAWRWLSGADVVCVRHVFVAVSALGLLAFAPVLIYVIPTVVQENLAAYGSKFLIYPLIVVVIILILAAFKRCPTCSLVSSPGSESSWPWVVWPISASSG
jgi:small-conductance mechanosensitive channel